MTPSKATHEQVGTAGVDHPHRELLIGCGSNRTRRVGLAPARCSRSAFEWTNLTTLDHNPDHKPDVVHDLEVLPLPFPDEHFQEIHAYEVLEHTGRQGDWRFFFAQFSDFWRLLKPGGILCASTPLPWSPWAFGDPSHTRIVSRECLAFLCQPEYTAQIGKTTMSDFRDVYRADFDLIHWQVLDPQGSAEWVLRAVKPSRITACRGPSSVVK